MDRPVPCGSSDVSIPHDAQVDSSSASSCLLSSAPYRQPHASLIETDDDACGGLLPIDVIASRPSYDVSLLDVRLLHVPPGHGSYQPHGKT